MSQTQVPTKYVNQGAQVPFIPTTQLFGGDMVVVGATPMLSPTDIAPNTLGALTALGRITPPKDASAFNQGDPVYWNPTGNPTGGTAGTGCATSQASGNYPLGMAVSTQATGDPTVDVLLNLKPTAGQLAAGATANDTIANTAAETAFATQATIPANTLKAGDVVKIRVAVEVTAQNSTNTNDVKLKILTSVGTFTAVVDTGAVNAAANAIALIDVDLVFTAVGATGSFYAVGMKAFGAQGTATMSPVALAATSIDTTKAVTIEVTDTQSAASAGNVAQLLELDVTIRRK